MAKFTCLITGANRGLGLGLVKTYLVRDSTTVVATVRDPGHASAEALKSLPKGTGSSLIVLKLDSSSESDAASAIASLASHSVTALDLVIANAGIFKGFLRVEESPSDLLLEHYLVNVVGPVRLFEAVRPLLLRAAAAKFVTLSSAASWITNMGPLPPNAVYGPSKAALNYITKKIHFENEQLTAFPIDPGFVGTDMGKWAAGLVGIAPPLTTEQSVAGLVAVIDKATRETVGGKLVSHEGEVEAF